MGNAGPAELEYLAAAALNGQKIKITDTAQHPFVPVTFEFNTNTVPGAVVITLAAGDSADVVAGKVAAAIANAQLAGRLSGLTPFATGARVSLGGSDQHLIDLSGAAAVTRLATGNVQLIVPTSIATLADGQTFTVQDGSGHSVRFELNNTNPALPATPVASGRVAIDVNLATATAANVAAAIATAVNGQVAARTLILGQSAAGAATASGVPVSIIGDDEDGVVFGGTFNAGANPSPAMAKALLVNSATPLGVIPNFNEGWGRVNVTNLIQPDVNVEYWDQPVIFANSGEQWTMSFGVADTSKPLKITLAWSDAPGAVGANPSLVNNLNLTVSNGANTYLATSSAAAGAPPAARPMCATTMRTATSRTRAT